MWRYDGKRDDEGRYLVETHNKHWMVGRTETERAAKLLAAAPDMHTALEIVLNNLEVMQPMIDFETDIDACTEALKQVKGGKL